MVQPQWFLLPKMRLSKNRHKSLQILKPYHGTMLMIKYYFIVHLWSPAAWSRDSSLNDLTLASPWLAFTKPLEGARKWHNMDQICNLKSLFALCQQQTNRSHSKPREDWINHSTTAVFQEGCTSCPEHKPQLDKTSEPSRGESMFHSYCHQISASVTNLPSSCHPMWPHWAQPHWGTGCRHCSSVTHTNEETFYNTDSWKHKD